MDIHNIDEYLDLQDQHQMNLLATEEIVQPEQQETEWHAAASSLDTIMDPANPYLFNENNNNNTDWGLLQNGLVDLQGINLTQIIGNGGILVSNQDNFITPDSLFKQPPLVEEKRVTRSRASTTTTPKVATTPKKKKKSTKKLYCICQQPYNGKPMVQCDRCEDWFHCTCVDFDPDDQEEEDIDWVCKKCLEAKKEEEPEKEVPTTAPPQPKVTITIPAPSTRQTRGSSRTQSQCLYTGCNNRTRADSYCSDVCARKKDEQPVKNEQPEKKVQPEKEEKAPRSTRLSRMRTASMSEAPKTRRASTSKKNSPTKITKMEVDEDVKEEDLKEEEEEDLKDDQALEKSDDDDEEEEEEEEEKTVTRESTVTREGTESPETPMSPSQMTEQENPVRRNVIKNMSSILKTIIHSALQENPDLFDSEQEKLISEEERAEKLARSIENTMLEQLGDMGKSQHRRTCGEPYKSKFRSLLYNLKDKQNKVFQVRVITGDLSPLELVKMSSEDMANPELKSMSEVLRKTALKNSVMKLDNTPIIKKTHKGDIIMVPNKDNDTNQNMYSEQVENIHIEHTTLPTPSPPSVLPSPKGDEKIITSFSPTSTGSKLDPLDDILARIGIPAHDDNNKRNASDAFAADPSKKRKVTLDVAELLGEEEETPFQVEEVDTSELLAQEQENNNHDNNEQEKEKKDEEMEEAIEPEEEKLPSIWEGRVNMPQVAEFEASARQIGGRILSESEWAEVLSPTMWIEGRIPAERVTSYVTQSQYSNSREIVLLEIEPNTTDQLKPKEVQLTNATQSQTLLKYLDSRQRYAVVGHNKTKVKDFYLIPLYKVQHIPDCLYVVRVEETKRECDLFLGVLVLSKQQPVTKPITTSAVTKPVYSTPMAQPMYLSTQTYSNYQPQPTQLPPPPPQPSQQQEYNYGYQQPSYGRSSSSNSNHNNNNNGGNQRNHYSSYNQRNNQNNSSHYRPSY